MSLFNYRSVSNNLAGNSFDTKILINQNDEVSVYSGSLIHWNFKDIPFHLSVIARSVDAVCYSNLISNIQMNVKGV